MIVAPACAPAPVASVAVSVDPDIVSQGQPVAVTYSFTPGSRIGALGSDHRVLVEFLDTSGAEMWRDHHMPTVRTLTWGPGDEVTYTRSTWVPVYAALGPARIRVSLESPRDGRKLPLEPSDGGTEFDRLPQFEILPALRNRYEITYGDGWHKPETSGLRARRWTTRAAAGTFANPARAATLYLLVSGRPELLGDPLQVTVDVAGETADRFRVETADDYMRAISLTKDQFGSAPLVDFTIRVSETFIPKQTIEGSSDGRRLGVNVSSIHVDVPVAPTHPAAGLGPAEIDAAGTSFRWGSRRVAIYGPPGAATLALPMRSGAPFPQTVRIVVNDVEAEQVELADDSWLVREYRVGPGVDGLVRVEVFTHPLWLTNGPEGANRGVMIGDYAWR